MRMSLTNNYLTILVLFFVFPLLIYFYSLGNSFDTCDMIHSIDCCCYCWCSHCCPFMLHLTLIWLEVNCFRHFELTKNVFMKCIGNHLNRTSTNGCNTFHHHHAEWTKTLMCSVGDGGDDRLTTHKLIRMVHQRLSGTNRNVLRLTNRPKYWLKDT